MDEAIAKHTESARTEESQYKSDLRGFVDDLSNVMHEFRNLDGKISKVSHTAIKIGDRLENVEEQRQQILDSEELIEHFLRFNKKEEFREIDPIFFAESGDSLYKAARLIIKLKDISQDLAFGETENAKKEINKISDRIKQNLTDEFIRAFRGKVIFFDLLCSTNYVQGYIYSKT